MKSREFPADLGRWIEMFNLDSEAREVHARLIGDSSKPFVEGLTKEIDSWPADLKKRIAKDERFPDPTASLAFLTFVLGRPRPTRSELHAAVMSMAVVGRYLSALPILANTSLSEALEMLRKAEERLTTKLEVHKRREGGIRSGKSRQSAREATIDAAARALLDLENSHPARVTLRDIAKRMDVRVERLQNIGRKKIAQRAESLRSSAPRKSTSSSGRKSRSK